MLSLIAHPVSGLLPAHCLQMSHEDYIRAIGCVRQLDLAHFDHLIWPTLLASYG